MLPKVIKPMLAQQAEEPFDSDNHFFEIKWDGIRCLALIEAGQVRLQSRRFLEITAQFPELSCLAQLPSGTILDGELIILHGGKPSLHEIQKRALLQSRTRIQFLSQITPVTYMVFDLLVLRGSSIMPSPSNLRRKRLQDLIEQFPVPGVLVTEVFRRYGRQLFARVERAGLEGIMAKRIDSPYLPGKRSRYWLKIKPRYREAQPEGLLI